MYRAQTVFPVRAGRQGQGSPWFAIAVLPDTQYVFDEDSSRPEPLKATFEHHGWIGDVRITGKALETRESLTAR